MKRWITVCALSACLMFAPTQSHAQVAEVLLKCTKSLGVAFACMVIQGGIAKAVDVSLEKLIAVAFGREKLDPNDTQPSKVAVADIDKNGIEWSKLKEFLVSLYKSDPNANDAEAREKVAASCNADWNPVCRYLGFPPPREELADCSKIATQQDCDLTMRCSWKDGSCAKGGGTRELFGR